MAKDGNITILAVDDNDALRYSLSRTLQAGGYRVIEARNGEEALRLAEQAPDLITLDVRLPDMDGFEVCRKLKSGSNTSHIPVLHISATFTDKEYRIRGLEAADGYLAEPISREELLATVAALLRLKQAEKEARLQADEAERARQELKQAHGELELRVQERTRELSAMTEEVRELTAKLIKLQDEERRRLARELHDSTGQTLAAMKMALDQMSSEVHGERMSSLLKETISLNEDISRQLRTMSYLLHPPLLDEAGLPSALQWYVNGFSQRSGITVDLQMSSDFGRLPQDMEIALFRVVQECLTNVHRHSGSSKAEIGLSRTAEQVSLSVTDAGKGIPSGSLPSGKVVPGVGLMGIKERVRQFGGNVEVRSSGRGTAVRATVPIKVELSPAV
jgi:signal transduction histidine kinase